MPSPNREKARRPASTQAVADRVWVGAVVAGVVAAVAVAAEAAGANAVPASNRVLDVSTVETAV
jgi:putative N-acetylmannosamine-6-phosphate epimerase